MGPLVAIWITSACVGLLVSAYGFYDAFRDLSATMAYGNGRRIVAVQRAFAQFTRILIFMGLVVVGMLALQIPPQDNVTDSTARSAIAVLLTAINVAYTIIAATDTYAAIRVRKG